MTTTMTAVCEDLAADAENPALERAWERAAVRMGLQSPSFADLVWTLTRAIGLGRPGHVRAELGWTEDREELMRWTGWCRSLIRDFPEITVRQGPNGGCSGSSRNIWALRLETARRFGFVPGRLVAALGTAHEEARRLGTTWGALEKSAPYGWEQWLRPSAKRTRRNVRKACAMP